VVANLELLEVHALLRIMRFDYTKMVFDFVGQSQNAVEITFCESGLHFQNSGKIWRAEQNFLSRICDHHPGIWSQSIACTALDMEHSLIETRGFLNLEQETA